MHKFQLHRRQTCGQTQHTTTSFQRRSKCSSATKGMCGSDNHAGNIDAFCGFIWGVWNPAEDWHHTQALCELEICKKQYRTEPSTADRAPLNKHKNRTPSSANLQYVLHPSSFGLKLPIVVFLRLIHQLRVLCQQYSSHIIAYAFQTSPRFNRMPGSNLMH